MTSQESTRETRLKITVVTITTREAGYYSPNREWLRRERYLQMGQRRPRSYDIVEIAVTPVCIGGTLIVCTRMLSSQTGNCSVVYLLLFY